MLSIIDKYVSKLFLTYFFAGLFIFITLFFVSDFMIKFSKYDASVVTLLRYYGYFLPEIIYQMLPVASLLASILTMSYLSSSNELVAFFTAGVSLMRVCTPILVLVGFLCLGSFFMGDRLIPHFMKQKNYIKDIEIKKYYTRIITGIKSDVWYKKNNFVVNVKSLDFTSRTGLGVSVFYFDQDWQLSRVVKAPKAKLGDSSWELFDSSETFYSSESSFPIRKTYNSRVIEMNKKLEDLNIKGQTSETMNLKTLKKFIDRNKKSGLNTLDYEVDYYAKYSFSFAGLLLVLMSLPFSISKRRSGGSLASIGACLGLVFSFWLFYSFSLNLGKMGVLFPSLAAWLPNFIIMLLAVFFLRKVET